MPNKVGKPIRSQTSEMKFGNTTYIVTTTFKEDAKETVEEKLARLVVDRIMANSNSSKTNKTSKESN